MGEHQGRSFMIKQRAMLKACLITMIETENLYGLEFRDFIREQYRDVGYRPNHSEIYKSLHELMEEGIVEQKKRKCQGKKLQEVVYYRIIDKNKADLYQKQVRMELERCDRLVHKTLARYYKMINQSL
ncbi:Replication termination protein [Bacillus megaterium]|nr:Replication termination protein [Priestia megaterium]